MNAQLDTTPASTEAAQAEIADEFAFFGDWTERYQYLIDLGRKLPPFPDALKTDDEQGDRLPVAGVAGRIGRCEAARFPGDQRFGDRVRA